MNLNIVKDNYSLNSNITLTTGTVSAPNTLGDLTLDSDTGVLQMYTGNNTWQTISTIDKYSSTAVASSSTFEELQAAIEKLGTNEVEIDKVARTGNKIIINWKDNTTTTYEGAPSEYLSDDELLYRAFSQKLFSNDNGKLKSSMELALSKLIREEEEVSW